jgi:four helix bundle protein
MEKGYRNLKAWQKANQLAHFIYNVTTNLLKSELFALTSQMRRAALSVPANIAEGYARRGQKERKHFFEVALASLTELEFYIDFSSERNYFDQSKYKNLIELQSETARILNGLINSLKRTSA